MPERKPCLKSVLPLLFVTTLLVLTCFDNTLGDARSKKGSAGNARSLCSERESEIRENFVSQKGWFTENRGQIRNQEIRFAYAGAECFLGFVESGYVVKMVGEDNLTSVLNVSFAGANPVIPAGEEKLSHKNNYFVGNRSAEWRTEVPAYNRITYKALYDGIDLIFYTTEDGLKYDFVVSPRAMPEEIAYSYEGCGDLFLDDQGNLHVTTPSGELVEQAPYSYQMKDGEKKEVSSCYRIDGRTVGIQTGKYEESTELIIDPLIFSTYLGGNGDDELLNIILDDENNAYVTGTTYSADFPNTTGCFDDSYNQDMDVFVCKLNPDGSDLIYSTFVGGRDYDKCASIALDSKNNAYIAGYTNSSDFPTTPGCFNDSYVSQFDEAFVFKLNWNGSDLSYSTFIGGDLFDRATGIAVDPDNSAYVTGYTLSSDFPITPGCFDDSANESWDVFALKLNHNGSDLLYSTFIGGDYIDMGYDIALDPENNAYITGHTWSSDFPNTTGCFDESYNDGTDVFVCKLNFNGSELIYSTFVGGEDMDYNTALALDNSGNAYITGYTLSSDFPNTTGCFDDSFNGDGEYDVFVSKLNWNGSELLYSTFVGGTSRDVGYDIVLDPDANAYITGSTSSADFPNTTNCFDDSFNEERDGFVCKLSSDGSTLLYSTFIGGNDRDYGNGITLDSSNNTVMIGGTISSDFPHTPGCFSDSHGGGRDGVVVKLNPGRPNVTIDAISPDPANEGEVVRFYGNGTDDGAIEEYMWHSDIDGLLSEERWFSHSNLSNGTHTISFKVKDSDNIWSEEATATLTINGVPRAAIDDVSPRIALDTDTILFQGSGTDDGTIAQYLWSSSIDGDLNLGLDPDFSFSSLSIGIHTISLRARDDHNAWSKAVNTTLVVHRKPIAIIGSISPNPALDTDVIRFSGSGIDDGEIQQYHWRSSAAGVLYNGSSSTFTTENLSVGNHTVYLKVRDSYNIWSEESSIDILVLSAEEITFTITSNLSDYTLKWSLFSGENTDEPFILVQNETGDTVQSDLYTSIPTENGHSVEIEEHGIINTRIQVKTLTKEPGTVEIPSVDTTLEISTCEDLSNETIIVTETTNNFLLNVDPLSQRQYIDVLTSDNISNAVDDAVIKVYYSEEEIPRGVNESSLRLFYWNDTIQGWEPVVVCGINTEENYVWAQVSHFSTYGIGEFNFPPVGDAGKEKNVRVGEETDLKGEASDNFNRNIIVLYEWDFDGDGTYDWSSPTTGVTTHSYDSPGTYYAKLRVTDDGGGKGFDTVEIRVSEDDDEKGFPLILVIVVIGILLLLWAYFSRKEAEGGDEGPAIKGIKRLKERQILPRTWLLLFLILVLVITSMICLPSGVNAAGDGSSSCDTTITDISSSDYSPVEGKTVTISAAVSNQGTSEAYTTVWFGYFGNFSAIGEDYTFTQPNETRITSIELDTTDMVGEKTIFVMIKNSDPAESNLSNNVGAATITLDIKPTEEATSSLSWLLPVIGIAGVIAAGSFLYLWKRREQSIFQMNDVFLVYNDGRLILHETTRLRPDFDAQIMSGMLTVVQEFIKDSLGKDEKEGELKRLQYEDLHILIEKGEYVHCCVSLSTSGEIPEEIRDWLKEAISLIEDEFHDVLDGWDGVTNDLRGTKDILRKVVISREEE